MNDQSSPVSSERDRLPGKRIGMFETAMLKLFMRHVRVVEVEDLNGRFRIITLGGDALTHVEWTPGDKIQMHLGGWIQRTYTPIDWDAVQGFTRFLVYLHGDGPGMEWARQVKAGDDAVVFGPRKSINLRQLEGPALIFGDETSLGLAATLSGIADRSEHIETWLEVSAVPDSRVVIERFGIRNVLVTERGEDDAHLLEIDDHMVAQLGTHRSMQFVLTGKATSIQQIRQLLRQHGVTSSRVQTKAYWAPGKKGLD
jgi:ferric-chelate reductase (NADPH)